MNLVYLSAAVIPSRTAYSVHVMRMCRALARHGPAVTLFAYGRAGPGAEDVYEYYGVENNFALRRLPLAGLRGATVLALPRLYRELRIYRPRDTLVYARSIYGAALAAHLGLSIVYEAHAPPAHVLMRRLEQKLFASGGFRKLVVISESLKRIYLARPQPPERIEVCPDAADPPPAGAADYPWPCARTRLQVGYVGHLYRGRGIELILACAARGGQCDFHLIGGTERDLRRWRGRGGPNVYFHGFVPPARVHAALRRCDVLLMPYQRALAVAGRNSDTSGWMSPMKLFEYMSARRAIIASDLPALREILNEDSALLVAPDDLDGWLAALGRCEDPACRERVAAAAHAQFLARHTWEQRAARALAGVCP